jgi:hypothetical protein
MTEQTRRENLSLDDHRRFLHMALLEGRHDAEGEAARSHVASCQICSSHVQRLSNVFAISPKAIPTTEPSTPATPEAQGSISRLRAVLERTRQGLVLTFAPPRLYQPASQAPREEQTKPKLVLEHHGGETQLVVDAGAAYRAWWLRAFTMSDRETRQVLLQVQLNDHGHAIVSVSEETDRSIFVEITPQ